MKNIFFYLVLILLIQSCTDSPISTNSNSKNIFFDLENYFDTQIKELNSKNKKIRKIITSSQKKEIKDTIPSNWENELALFKKSAINKPAWEDKYQIDSTYKKKDLLLVQYRAKEASLYTQKIDIEWKSKKIHSIIIVNTVKNEIYESQQYLTYIPDKEYSIKKTQSVTLMDKDDYEIEVFFMN